MTEKRISRAQSKLYEYLKDRLADESRISPSYREIARELGYRSVSPVATHVNALVDLKLLVKEENAARSLRLASEKVEGVSADIESMCLEWLRKEIDKRKEYPEQAEKLRAALEVLDQTEEK